jgi:hypothetical protein
MKTNKSTSHPVTPAKTSKPKSIPTCFAKKTLFQCVTEAQTPSKKTSATAIVLYEDSMPVAAFFANTYGIKNTFTNTDDALNVSSLKLKARFNSLNDVTVILQGKSTNLSLQGVAHWVVFPNTDDKDETTNGTHDFTESFETLLDHFKASYPSNHLVKSVYSEDENTEELHELLTKFIKGRYAYDTIEN